MAVFPTNRGKMLSITGIFTLKEVGPSLDSETHEGTVGDRGCHLKHLLYQHIVDVTILD